MDLKVFDGQDKSELSMIEVAHAILSQHGETMAFADLVNEVQQYLGKSDEEIRERISQFYTDLNIDGSFISLGNNTWGLRAWYPYDSIDEATVGEAEDDDEDDEEKDRRKKHHRVNAFLADDNSDDIIDYENDDPEDDDLDNTDSNDDDYGEDNYDDESDANTDTDDTDIENQLSELKDDTDDDDDDD